MPNLPSEITLQEIIEYAHVPAVSYSYVEPTEENEEKYTSNSISLGKKNAQSTDEMNEVDDDTLFPASSLSKIVFTYLVLQLVDKQHLNLDESLHNILKYKRFLVNELSMMSDFPNDKSKINENTVYIEGKDDRIYYKTIVNDELIEDTISFNDINVTDEQFNDAISSNDITFFNNIKIQILDVILQRGHIHGEYPEQASQLTARHVLSHTTGLPNVGTDPNSALAFNSNPGEIYSYSGEAFLYLQEAIETKMGKNLETLAQEYVFTSLKMENSTFRPPDDDTLNTVKVHTELGQPKDIYIGKPLVHAAGSLLTTADDFSKFMAAWLENMDDPIIKQAFESPEGKEIPTFDKKEDFPVCGLGWHLFKDDDGKLIAYQYGENPNTRAFTAINLTDRKGAAFFTNSEYGMSIANEVLCSDRLGFIANMQLVFKDLNYTQCDEPGWQETIAGKIAEDQGNIKEARVHFEEAINAAPDDESKQRRLEWFNVAHSSNPRREEFTEPLETFVGEYKNPYNEEADIFIKNDSLIYKKFDDEIKLVRVSENKFLPEKNQIFQISLNEDQMTINYINGWEKSLSKQQLLKSQEVTTSYAIISKKLGNQPNYKTPIRETEIVSSDQNEIDDKNHIEKEQESQTDPTSENEEVQYRPT